MNEILWECKYYPIDDLTEEDKKNPLPFYATGFCDYHQGDLCQLGGWCTLHQAKFTTPKEEK